MSELGVDRSQSRRGRAPPTTSRRGRPACSGATSPTRAGRSAAALGCWGSRRRAPPHHSAIELARGSPRSAPTDARRAGPRRRVRRSRRRRRVCTRGARARRSTAGSVRAASSPSALMTVCSFIATRESTFDHLPSAPSTLTFSQRWRWMCGSSARERRCCSSTTSMRVMSSRMSPPCPRRALSSSAR